MRKSGFEYTDIVKHVGDFFLKSSFPNDPSESRISIQNQ